MLDAAPGRPGEARPAVHPGRPATARSRRRCARTPRWRPRPATAPTAASPTGRAADRVHVGSATAAANPADRDRSGIGRISAEHAGASNCAERWRFGFIRARRFMRMSPVLTMQDALLALTSVLDRPRLHGRAAVQHRGRRRDAEPGDDPAGARARAVAGRLRRAECAPRRLPLRREPEPAADPHPVPGDPQAGPGQPAGAVPGQPRRARHRHRTRTTCGSSRTTGPHPALGAWGLGWEVWLDGLEITQFTYFQQAGGIDLDPVSVEITYGIERIMMALQGVAPLQGHRLRRRASPTARCSARPSTRCAATTSTTPTSTTNRGCSRRTRPRRGG